jgi:hypothetical protein
LCPQNLFLWVSYDSLNKQLILPGSIGTIGSVPRAYDMFRAYKGIEGRDMKRKYYKIGKFNTK